METIDLSKFEPQEMLNHTSKRKKLPNGNVTGIAQG